MEKEAGEKTLQDSSAAEAVVAYTSSTKRIAKNTLMLYFRQILIMLVSLYTVRVVLSTLGAEDYGIYNVVAGVVVMFGFVNNAMASGTQRFLNFYIGKNNEERTNQVYSASLVIHSLIAVVFVVVAETVGLWFVGLKLNIPMERHNVAMVVYQFTILTTVFSILRVPYNATVIAYERMSFFALLSIVETVLKLAVVFFLQISSFDKLIFYAFLLTVVAFVVSLVYKIYCNKIFAIAHYKRVKDFGFVKEQLSFSGWSLFGAVANVCCSQGTNIVLNMFTNVTVNAAMGIANQVNAAVYSFVGNFQTAFNPQIVKSYAEGNRKYFIDLICGASKVAFFLLTFLTVPLLVNCEFVLSVWLKNVPEYSVRFVQLILIWSLIDSWNGPLWMAIQATGNIRKYQVLISLFIFLNFPFTIIAFLLGASPEWILIIRIAINLFNTFWRVFFLYPRISLPRRRFVFGVVLRCSVVFVASLALTSLFGRLFSGSVLRFFMTCMVSVVLNAVFVMVFGVSSAERKAVFAFVRNRLGGAR